jgi:methyltransferase
MSLNKYMHPRNPFYNNPPNFEQLAKLYPDFSNFLKLNDKNKLAIDFMDANSLKALCCVLLKHLYGIYFLLSENISLNKFTSKYL